MARLLTIVTAFCFGITLSASSYSQNLLKHLLYVNEQWQHQPELSNILSSTTFPDYQNHKQWINFHLQLVEKTLRIRSVEHLNRTQLENRLGLLEKLKSYAIAEAFPINEYLPYKNPVFIDRVGTHCAVGYLMQQSGAEALAQTIDANEKFAYVFQIKTSGVKEWAQANGFTLSELALIQPGYEPDKNTFDMDGGLDGQVDVLVADSVSKIVYAGGAFTNTTLGINCNNIGAWVPVGQGWEWQALAGGVNGPVKALMVHNGLLYVGGDFSTAGGIAANHVAAYNIASGQWQALGSLNNTVNAFEVYNGAVYASGRFSGLVAKWTGTNWQNINQGFITGTDARTLEVYNNQLLIGGNFTVPSATGIKHVATYNGSQMGTLAAGTLCAVNDFQFFFGKLYAACDSAALCALARYENNGWSVIIKDSLRQMPITASFWGKRINKLAVLDTLLVGGGEFESVCCLSSPNFGYNLMAFMPSTNILQYVF